MGEQQASLTLAERFAEATQAHARVVDSSVLGLVSGEQADTAEPQDAREALGILHRCCQAVDAAGLFSRNEAVEDVPTEHLRFLLCRYLLGEVLLSTHTGERAAVLKGAATELRLYLRWCDDLGCIHEVDREGLHRDQPPDAATRRTQKIARFKAERALQAKLEAFEASRRRANVGEEQQEQLSEEQRECWLLRIKAAAGAALGHLELIDTELEVLAVRGTVDEPGTGHALLTPKEVFLPPQLRDAAAALGQDRRGQIHNQVFRPSHILPTMTVEQFGELEHQRMMHQSAAAQAGRARITEVDDDDEEDEEDEYSDAAVEKARQKDDFNDANPRGWGNSKLRPCAQ